MGSGLTKIGNLSTVNILFFKKGRSRKVTLTSHHRPPPQPTHTHTLFLSEEEKYVKYSPPVPERKTTFLLPEAGKSAQTNLVKLTLTFLVISSPPIPQTALVSSSQTYYFFF